MTRRSPTGSRKRSTTSRPDYRAFGGRLIETLRYGENPHQAAAFYRTPDCAFRRRHRAPGPGQAALLQQHQRHRRGLRMRCRVRSGAHRGLRHHQARQSVRRRRGRQSARRLSQSPCLRPDLSFRRHRRAQPHARCAKRRAPSPKSSPKSSSRRTPRAEAIAIVGAKKNLRLLLAGGVPDPRAAGLTAKTVAGGLLVQTRDNAVVDDMDLKPVTKRAPTQCRVARPALRLPRRQARQIERHRLCQGSAPPSASAPGR